MQKILLAALLLVVVIGTLVIVRTSLHVPTQHEPIPRVEIELDETIIARHLSEAVQIQTVSHQRSENANQEAFEDFITWVGATYPSVNESMTLTRLGQYSMLYRWVGRNEDLAPILITAHYDVVPVIPGTESLWTHPPFAGQIEDGVIWGRGTLDDKSAVVAQLEAAT